MCFGIPTTTLSIFLSRTISLIRATAFCFDGIVSSGWGGKRSSSEIGIPMRGRPKSTPKIGFIPGLLQLRRKFADQVLDFFSLVPVTYQNRVTCAHNDKIMHA